MVRNDAGRPLNAARLMPAERRLNFQPVLPGPSVESVDQDHDTKTVIHVRSTWVVALHPVRKCLEAEFADNLNGGGQREKRESARVCLTKMCGGIKYN